MTADDIQARDAVSPEAENDPAAPEAEIVHMNATAVATARAGSLAATQSAIGSASVDGDASIDTSLVGMVSAKGNAALKQGCAAAIMAEGDVTVSQGGGAVIVGRTVDVDQGGSCVMVSGETTASRSYVGLLLSRKASFSEDSRVLFDWKAALILAAVMLGGVGLVILVVVVVARMLMGRIHNLAERLPHLSVPHMPEVPPWVSAVARRIRAA
jgi:hypothetical protein